MLVKMPVKMSPCGNIVLVGLSGAGKTSCAQILAKFLDLSVLDTDDIIQKNAGMSVASIFAENGEAYFRVLERQLIERLLDEKLKGTVLSVGGGLPAEADNIQLLKKLGITIFLNASPGTLTRRLAQDLTRDHHRPLLARAKGCEGGEAEKKEEDLEAALANQLARRLKYYQEAHLVIDTNGKSKHDICLEIQTMIINHPLPPLAL